jgi:hypothetical protein
MYLKLYCVTGTLFSAVVKALFYRTEGRGFETR